MRTRQIQSALHCLAARLHQLPLVAIQRSAQLLGHLQEMSDKVVLFVTIRQPPSLVKLLPCARLLGVLNNIHCYFLHKASWFSIFMREMPRHNSAVLRYASHKPHSKYVPSLTHCFEV